MIILNEDSDREEVLCFLNILYIIFQLHDDDHQT